MLPFKYRFAFGNFSYLCSSFSDPFTKEEEQISIGKEEKMEEAAEADSGDDFILDEQQICRKQNAR